MPPEHTDILIILPAYNEGTVIAKVVRQVQSAGYRHICVVNDGSKDDTFQRAKSTGAVVLSHPINRGAGAAVQTGLTYAKNNNFQYAATMDSDGQHLVGDVAALFGAMEHSAADIVVGNRFILQENNIPAQRIVYNKIANLLTNLFCHHTYQDTQSGFRLFNRNAIEKLAIKNRGYGFCSEMFFLAEQAGLVVTEAPIKVIYTEYSISKGQSLSVGIKTARSLLWRIIFE